MTELLSIDIIDNGKGGHEDLKFSIPNLVGDRLYDTYYIGLAIEPIESIDKIKNAVSLLLQFWLEKIERCKIGETIYLPIDFSDQYTGCLKVLKLDKNLELSYGFSTKQDAVYGIDPEIFHKDTDDFQPESDKQLILDQNIFISALEKQIHKLKKMVE